MSSFSTILNILLNTTIAEWNFTRNCSAAGPFLQESEELINGPSITSALSFLHASLPRAILNTTNSLPTADLNGALLQWLLNTKIPNATLNNAMIQCKPQFCPLLTPPGSEPDACGIGVIAAAFIQSSITTLYAILFILDRIFSPSSSSSSSHPKLNKLKQTLEACIRINLDAIRQFSIALLVSAIIITASTDALTSSVHSLRKAGYAASTFVLSYFILEFISWEWCQVAAQRRYFLAPAGFLGLFLGLVGVVHARVNNRGHGHDMEGGRGGGGETAFDRVCYDVGDVRFLEERMHLVVIVVSALLVGSFGGWGVLKWRRRRGVARGMRRNGGGDDDDDDDDGRVRGVERGVQVAVVVLLLLGLVVVVSSLVTYRHLVSGALGRVNPEGEWTLGQIAAVATWVPLVVDLAFILSNGGGREGALLVWRWRLPRYMRLSERVM